MPKKTKKAPKIAFLSDTDSDSNDDFKIPKKKGHKFAIIDSDDDDFSTPKPSTLKGKIRTLIFPLVRSTNFSSFERSMIDHCQLRIPIPFHILKFEENLSVTSRMPISVIEI